MAREGLCWISDSLMAIDLSCHQGSAIYTCGYKATFVSVSHEETRQSFTKGETVIGCGTAEYGGMKAEDYIPFHWLNTWSDCGSWEARGGEGRLWEVFLARFINFTLSCRRNTATLGPFVQAYWVNDFSARLIWCRPIAYKRKVQGMHTWPHKNNGGERVSDVFHELWPAMRRADAAFPFICPFEILSNKYLLFVTLVSSANYPLRTWTDEW